MFFLSLLLTALPLVAAWGGPGNVQCQTTVPSYPKGWAVWAGSEFVTGYRCVLDNFVHFAPNPTGPYSDFGAGTVVRHPSFTSAGAYLATKNNWTPKVLYSFEENYLISDTPDFTFCPENGNQFNGLNTPACGAYQCPAGQANCNGVLCDVRDVNSGSIDVTVDPHKYVTLQSDLYDYRDIQVGYRGTLALPKPGVYSFSTLFVADGAKLVLKTPGVYELRVADGFKGKQQVNKAQQPAKQAKQGLKKGTNVAALLQEKQAHLAAQLNATRAKRYNLDTFISFGDQSSIQFTAGSRVTLYSTFSDIYIGNGKRGEAAWPVDIIQSGPDQFDASVIVGNFRSIKGSIRSGASVLLANEVTVLLP